MSQVFAENNNNDIYIGANNQLVVSTDLLSVLQGCKATVEIQTGEALYAQENGVPDNSITWNGTPNLQQFEFFARKQITNVTGVTGIKTFDIAINDNVLQYQITIKTIFGNGDINGNI